MKITKAFGVAAVIAMCLVQVQAQGAFTISVLSSRPDMVSGGNALIQVAPAAASIKVLVNGQDATAAFRGDGPRLVGLVEQLRDGTNVIEARRGTRTARLEITNHPITGPIVSGEHLTPFVCRTLESGLGEPLDEHCSAATKVDYFYRSNTATPSFKPLGGPSDRPADLAETTTSEGKTVPYIVRVESGTINRAIYRIAMLEQGWNRRLMFSFGGGCGTNYNQGTNQATAPLSHLALSRGFAHAVSTQNVMQQHCNDHLSGEALMMIKEHFIERHGVPVWTLGFGGSGGAIQQLLISQNFPGLLDGILPGLTYPDSISTRPGVTDCRLLMRVYRADPATWTQEKQTAVEGYTPGTCRAWDRSFIDIIVAVNARGCGIAEELVYDPVKNPKGARCTMWDTNVASFGRDPGTGFARRSLDNVGVQYGLDALNRGLITPVEFLDLNEKIGGFDDDGVLRAARTVADTEAVRLAYASGRLNSGAGGLATVPILHYRSYNDPTGDIHDRFRDFTMRERLRKANGHADNQVIWVYPNGVSGLPATVAGLAVDTMSAWLDELAGLKPAPSTRPPTIDAIRRAKPAAAVDGCWDATGTRIDEPATFDGPGRCNALYPNHRNPRLVAGARLTDDVLKCQLKPIDSRDYRVTFAAGEMTRLRSVFPAGVCDYSKPGVAQVPLAGTYQRLPLAAPSPTRRD
ncbi:MAG TPA: DUF6351 family protein [Vicinamibacterales bacterium]|nr:DUF6351 family protein [Vicinamibacterales bacterium]